jgi:hypothetical protein
VLVEGREASLPHHRGAGPFRDGIRGLIEGADLLAAELAVGVGQGERLVAATGVRDAPAAGELAALDAGGQAALAAVHARALTPV